MLTHFTVERHFNKLHVTLLVEPVKQHADITITYDRRIVHLGEVPTHNRHLVMTPEGAEAWLSSAAGERGTLVETWEHRYRTAA